MLKNVEFIEFLCCKNATTINYIFKKQVCIYAYSKDDLNKFLSFGRKSKLEKIEDIEILRFFELNKKIFAD